MQQHLISVDTYHIVIVMVVEPRGIFLYHGRVHFYGLQIKFHLNKTDNVRHAFVCVCKLAQ